MAHLLHIDSSVQGDLSVSRALTARAAKAWRATNPGGTITYRDLGAEPLPHFTHETGRARMVPAEQRTPAEAASWALTERVVGEVLDADTIIFGLPIYNFGPPSSVKSWVDHMIAPGLSIDAETRAGLLGGRDMLVLASKGGGYQPGTPREGWDHAAPWLPHGLSLTGLEPRFITAELTLANSNPQMADLKPLAAESLAAAEREIDAQWASVAA
jgi:FMN-dependent NADH-azoreductase